MDNCLLSKDIIYYELFSYMTIEEQFKFRVLCKETKCMFEKFIKLKNRFITLCHSKINDDGLQAFESGAHYIHLQACKNITSEGLKYLKNVKHLDLRETDINCKGLKYIEQVTTLNLSNMDIDTSYLQDLKYLKRLELNNCHLNNESSSYSTINKYVEITMKKCVIY